MSKPDLESLRTQDYVVSLRERVRLLHGKVTLQHSPEQLWPALSNTDQVNAKAGLAPVTIFTRARKVGGSDLTVKTRDLGFLDLAYEELPYEWSAPNYFWVERIYSKGPTAYVSFRVELEALHTGQTEVSVTIGLVPKLPYFLVKLKLKGILKRMLEAYREIDLRLIDQTQQAISAFLEDAVKHQDKIDKLLVAWEDKSKYSNIPVQVARHLYTAPDSFVRKLRPFELASLYGLDRLETLRFFLRATAAGYFNMSWDLLCPSCKGAKSETMRLSEVTSEVHCDSCGIDFGVRFDDNFELTFYPVQTIRSVEDSAFCAGSPANTAHVVWQKNFWPQERYTEKLKLTPGSYRLRALSMKGNLFFEVAEGGRSVLELSLEENFKAQANLVLAPEVELQIYNWRNVFQTLKLEDLKWRRDTVSAAYVSSLQDFREMFGSEVLRPGVQLEISNICVMFTDLKDSTALYELEGDAFAFNLVQEHFEIMIDLIKRFEGGIVKTIGDAVMAVFHDPLQAMACALQIHEDFKIWNEKHPDRLVILKVGIHKGPCIALTLNNKLDYFGSTINKAARIQGESVGKDIVVSEAFLNEPGVQRLLPVDTYEVDAFVRNLKGLNSKMRLFRILKHIP